MAVKEKAQEAMAETVPVKAKAVECLYTAAELADNHKVFMVSREIVVVALRLAGVKEATVSEAKSIIDKFKNKEVK